MIQVHMRDFIAHSPYNLNLHHQNSFALQTNFQKKVAFKSMRTPRNNAIIYIVKLLFCFLPSRSESGKSVSTRNLRKRFKDFDTSGKERPSYKRHGKPPYSYVGIIAAAIWISKRKCLFLSEIISTMRSMFPFFQPDSGYSGWQESVRHNLSQNECFIKVLKDGQQPKTRGNMWTVDWQKLPPSAFVLQMTSVSRDGHYKAHLLDQLKVENWPDVEVSRAAMNLCHVSECIESPRKKRSAAVRESSGQPSGASSGPGEEKPLTPKVESALTTTFQSPSLDGNNNDVNSASSVLNQPGPFKSERNSLTSPPEGNSSNLLYQFADFVLQMGKPLKL